MRTKEEPCGILRVEISAKKPLAACSSGSLAFMHPQSSLKFILNKLRYELDEYHVTVFKATPTTSNRVAW